jgi:hypothetical protein
MRDSHTTLVFPGNPHHIATLQRQPTLQVIHFRPPFFAERIAALLS